MDLDDPDSLRPRKHRRDSINGLNIEPVSSLPPAAKRSRRSNGTVAATTNGTHGKSGDTMDVDQIGSSHVDSTSKRQSPIPPNAPPASGISMGLKTEGCVDASEVGVANSNAHANASARSDADDDAVQAQPTVTLIPTLTNGCSVGVQNDKVAELGPETTVLSVPDRNVTHAAWNPRDPALLATGGHELFRIWTIPRMTNNHTHHDLLDPQDPLLVTSMAWSPDGESLAVATHGFHADSKGSVTIRTKTGELQDELPGGQDWVSNLAWNQTGSLLLGITQSGDGNHSNLIVWDIKMGQPMEPKELPNPVFDATWVDDRKFLLCGTGIIAEAIVDGAIITALRKRDEVGETQEWTKICHDSITHVTAIVAESKGILAIIDSEGIFHMNDKAHYGEITALAFQPIVNPSSLAGSSPRLLATSSSSGNITIWNARNPFSITYTLSLGATPALAMRFTPDGHLVAAANWNRVVMWKAEAGKEPKTIWINEDGQRQPEGHVQTNGEVDMINGDEEIQPVHSLGWDADGHKLAYGFKNQVSPLVVYQNEKPTLIIGCHNKFPTNSKLVIILLSTKISTTVAFLVPSRHTTSMKYASHHGLTSS